MDVYRLAFFTGVCRATRAAGAILRGEVASNAFADQIAIIGATAIGVTDVVATPIAAHMEVRKSKPSSLKDSRRQRLKRPPAISWAELPRFS